MLMALTGYGMHDMKNIITTLLLLAAMGCEFHPPHDHNKPTVVYPTTTTITPIVTVDYCGYDSYPYPIEWVDYCGVNCCMWEIWDGEWMCQQLWCYDNVLCEWDLTELCY